MPDLTKDSTLTPEEIIVRRFKYHAPSEKTALIHSRVADLCKEVAIAILNTTEHSRERSLALTKLEELRMNWNQAVAFDGQGFDPANR